MRILLDNCVHRKAHELFVGHDVTHARDRGWRQLSNGELIAVAAAAGFELFATCDKKIRYEQNLVRLPIPMLELNPHFTRLKDLRLLAPHIANAIAETTRFRFVSLTSDGMMKLLAPLNAS